MDLPLESIPDGWTTDPAEIQFELIWKGPESEGQKMARRFGLSSPQVVMTSRRETGVPEAMFESDNRCFIWDQMDDTVWQITKPVGLMSVLHTMVTKGQKALKAKELATVEVWEDEDSKYTE
ncbi:hypothetical protein ABOM_002154 [Aspergillus bombycis]|uniref:Uncharacterized protein n=1 Tax=Aspergillus bombycis TaxID=109264 RepID=A0A1F8A975_9EURO|nr:hypothetical protein ABOM_002154 [Aspergillus bombycis]OGM48284.1 hypothetical protein ABOM_002154 [Aspergillus bombycis]